MSTNTGAMALRQLLATAEPPDLGPDARVGVEPLKTLGSRIDVASRDLTLPDSHRELARAMIFLWHDHLEAAHRIAQAIEDIDGSYVHGLMHRREPDYWNSKYWFRQAGRHPIHPALACKAHSLLDAANEPGLKEKLLPGGEWDPFAFVDACENAAKRHLSAPVRSALRAIQGAEFGLLLDYFLGVRG